MGDDTEVTLLDDVRFAGNDEIDNVRVRIWFSRNTSGAVDLPKPATLRHQVCLVSDGFAFGPMETKKAEFILPLLIYQLRVISLISRYGCILCCPVMSTIMAIKVSFLWFCRILND